MTIRRNKLTGQTNGANATPSNAATSGDAWTANNVPAGSLTYDTSNLPSGAGAWVKATPATSNICNFDDTTFSSNDVQVEDTFLWPGNPTINNTPFYQFRGAGGRAIDFCGTTAGKVQMVAAANIGSASAVALTAGTKYRIRAKVHTDPTTPANGTASYAIYDMAGTLIASGSGTGTINNGPITTLKRGCTSASFAVSGNWASWEYALLQYGDVTTDIGPYPTNVAPTANAGPDQINVEPYDTVNLSGTGSSDPDGSISSYAWTQTGGTAVTLAGAATATPSFVAPATLAGDTLTFSLTVTDNLGATSAPDTVSVTVLPHTTWRLDAGGPVPVRFIRL